MDLEASIQAIEERSDLNALITVCADEALARARESPSGLLAGVALFVKDLFDTAGIRTTYGSSIYAEHVPERTAPAVERLEAAGAIMVGKANLDDFAWSQLRHRRPDGAHGRGLRARVLNADGQADAGWAGRRSLSASSRSQAGTT